MKRFLTIIMLFFLVAAIGLFVFVLTFDVNRYKPLLIEKIEGLIKRDIKISNISLNIIPRTVIRMNGVSIKDKDKTWDEVMLKAGLLEATIKLLPLLRKDVQIEKLTIKGVNVNLADLDVSSLPAFKLDITEAAFENISLYGPIQASGKLSFFGRGRENVELKAVLYPEIETKRPYLKNVEARVDLEKLDFVALLNALGQPEISRQFVGKEAAGRLTISSEEMRLDPEKIYDSDIYIDLSNGMTDIIPVKDGINKVQLKATLRNGTFDIEKLTGSISGGSFSVKGGVEDIYVRQNAKIGLTLQGIRLEDLLPDTLPGQPYMEGGLRLDADSSFNGLEKESVINSLSTKGTVRLDRAVLNNMNILAVSLDQLNMLPGLVQKLKNKLPERHKEILKQNYTTFSPVETEFYFKNGKFLIQDFLIESDAFYIAGQCSLDAAGVIFVTSDLFIPADLSAAFTGVVRELGYLQNSDGMITMPLAITGKLPDIEIKPDLNYVISRLAVSKGQELLESIFKKKEDQGSGGGSEAVPSQPEEAGQTQSSQPEKMKPEEAIIRTIFDIISAPKE